MPDVYGAAIDRPSIGKLRDVERAIRSSDQIKRVPYFWRFAKDYPTRPHLASSSAYRENALEILRRHDAQTTESVAELKKKYAVPVFGRVRVWNLVEMLAQCIDASDTHLVAVSQQVHVLQMLEEMEADGVATKEFVLAALVHDLGKVLLLTDEAPENVVGLNNPIGSYEPGIGLDNCIMQWNHDEFAYSRLKDHLDDGLAWLVRYHSIRLPTCGQYMDARDRALYDRYLRLFAHYDHGTKYPHFLPKKRISDYRHIIEEAFPNPIDF